MIANTPRYDCQHNTLRLSLNLDNILVERQNNMSFFCTSKIIRNFAKENTNLKYYEGIID